MKLVVSGGSGFVATEIIKQGLQLPRVTKLVVLSRKPISTPQDVDTTKLKNVILKDYDEYSKEARDEMAGADACVWTVSVTPTKSRMYKPEELKRVCHTCTLAGMKAMLESGPAKPFRFIYMSGGAEEYKTNKLAPAWIVDYLDMRRQTEREVREMAQVHDSENIQVGVLRAGLITSNVSLWRATWGLVLGSTLRLLGVADWCSVEEVAAATLHQALQGVTKETLQEDEIKKLGQDAIGEWAREAREVGDK